ncbi:MAG: S-layer family protein [Cyanobacteria bacterium J06623_5]
MLSAARKSFHGLIELLVVCCIRLALPGVALKFVLAGAAIAQTTPDASLSAESSTVQPAAASINGRSAEVVEGGATRGESLFHSFRELNIGDQEQLYFSPDAAISTIFTRVTGDNSSQILGTLGVFGDADFFLINPNGVFFGPNAQLDLSGSFLVSSADEIAFGDTFAFGTRSLTAPPQTLLTVQPSALMFNRLSPAAPIESQAQLELAMGERFQAVGGDVILIGLADSPQATITAREGLVELGGLAAAGAVGLSAEGRLQFADDAARANVELSRARLQVNNAGGGDINLVAHDISLDDSRLTAGYRSRQGLAQSQSGDITLDATGNFTTSRASISNSLTQQSRGTAGNILISVGEDLFLSNSQITSNLEGTGANSDIDIRVAGDATVSATVIQNAVLETGVGNAGNLTIRAGLLLMETPNPNGRQAFVTTDTTGQGDAGRLLIEADALTVVGPGISGPSGITSTSGGSGTTGNAGSIILNIRGPFVMTERGKIESAVTRGSTGIGGDVSITAESMQLSNTSFVQVRNNRAIGLPGNVDINLTGELTLTGNSFVDTAFSAQSIGIERSSETENGNISIDASAVRLSDQGYIRVSTFGGGDAGRIEITADLIEIDDPYIQGEISSASGLFSRTRPGAGGIGGDITLRTQHLRVNENSVINAQTDSDFRGGSIQIEADRIELTNGGQILASASSAGAAGDINIVAGEEIVIAGQDENYALQVIDATERVGLGFIGDLRRILNREGEDGVASSGIFLQSLGEEANAGSAGSLTIEEAPGGNLNLILADGAEINAETVSTTGGNLTFLDLNAVLLRGGSSITAEAGDAQRAGNGGNITFSMPEGIVVAVPDENSDIVANAFEGNGGNINILSRNIIGLEARDVRSPASDISASSEFGSDGQVRLQTLNVDPDQGLVSLPVNLDDQSDRIDRRCLADSQQEGSSFAITGTGGAPPNPRDIIRNESAGLIDFGSQSAARSPGPVSGPVSGPGDGDYDMGTPIFEPPDIAGSLTQPMPVVEAQGWQRDQHGKVSLVAEQPYPEAASGLIPSQACVQQRGA